MTAIAFDTLQIHKKLVSNGFTEKQAEALVETISDVDTSHVVTNSDLRFELEKTKNEMLKWYIGIAIIQTFAMLGGIITLVKILQP